MPLQNDDHDNGDETPRVPIVYEKKNSSFLIVGWGDNCMRCMFTALLWIAKAKNHRGC